jgi:hypothetical protein
MTVLQMAVWYNRLELVEVLLSRNPFTSPSDHHLGCSSSIYYDNVTQSMGNVIFEVTVELIASDQVSTFSAVTNGDESIIGSHVILIIVTLSLLSLCVARSLDVAILPMMQLLVAAGAPVDNRTSVTTV